MKTIIVTSDKTEVLEMEPVDDAYFQGRGLHPGYSIVERDWDKIPGAGMECIQMGLYEGASCVGSYHGFDDETEESFGFSWAVLPENEEENEHLREHCALVTFANMS